MKKSIFPVIITAAVTSIFTLFAAAKFQGDDISSVFSKKQPTLPVNYVGFNEEMGTVHSNTPVDFQPAAEGSVKAVVHIKTSTKERVQRVNTFWGEGYNVLPPQVGSGSGVVISADGYIVTNNHVVSEADVVTVTFNDRYTAEAKVVAKDASTDLAVLKVEEKNLPYMEFGNSDDVRLGQWVLAVGYPFSLDATVTAGIVSAKSRSLGINSRLSTSAIESFIQTDAAVNPGNSGGALVNMKGQLIGINSAIASPTGSYAGYSYSIPANIVKKVVNDLIEVGTVQRAYLGIRFYDRKALSVEKLKELGIDKSTGVYIAGVQPGSGAEKAGLTTGDFITEVNGVIVRTEPELLEKVAMFKPGDNISVTYIRGGETRKTSVELKKLAANSLQLLGASFQQLNAEKKKALGVKSGLLVTDKGSGLLGSKTNMQNNFLITAANGVEINTLDDLQKVLESSTSVRFDGFYPNNKSRGMYYYGLNLEE
jgi:serine protease Do